MANLSAKRIDWILVLATFLVVGIGLPYLYSASPFFFRKQLLWVFCGTFIMFFMLAIDYRILLRYAYVFYAFVLALLLLVLLLPAVRGAHSWIRMPVLGFNIQPSELMKLAIVLVLARHLMYRENQSSLRGLVMPFVLTLLPMALVLKQPDLGTTLLFPPLLFAVVYASGARVLHLSLVALSGALSSIPMWLYIMKPYQKRRVLAFLHPETYEAREAYQILMSLIAIGSGGLFGEGLGNGTLNSLDLLPDKHTDFIFGVIAEEGGFFVTSLLLASYLCIIGSGLAIADNTREPGGRLIAVGASALIGAQLFINIGVVTSLFPTTGIPLPLVSYGGSSMMVTFALIGLMLNVGARRPLHVAGESFRGLED